MRSRERWRLTRANGKPGKRSWLLAVKASSLSPSASLCVCVSICLALNVHVAGAVAGDKPSMQLANLLQGFGPLQMLQLQSQIKPFLPSPAAVREASAGQGAAGSPSVALAQPPAPAPPAFAPASATEQG
jgi:hypothetical protein